MLYLKLTLFFLLTLTLYSNDTLSQDIKEKSIYPMGAKVYAKKCPHLNIKQYKSYKELHTALSTQEVCTKLKPKYLEALALYIWDVKRVHKKFYAKLTVTDKEKCQVCGMYLHYYPTWVAEINYPKNEIYKFDGIRDMMKFYFNNKEGIVDILVQDYYTLETLNAKEAFFVIGSDVRGPMGHELIAFSDRKKAMSFALEHKGHQPLHFNEITEYMVRHLE